MRDVPSLCRYFCFWFLLQDFDIPFSITEKLLRDSMAAAKKDTKRGSRRKARTEGVTLTEKQVCKKPTDTLKVSSSSSSDSESSSSAHVPVEAANKTVLSTASAETGDEAISEAEPVFTKKHVNPEKSFENFYLLQATREFANDLDKLRSASDFNPRSVPLLIKALKQGTSCFSKEERVRVGGAVESET